MKAGVLPLYFSRPLRAADYVIAKFAAMTAAIWLLLVQASLGAFDTLYYHEYRLKLPSGAHTRVELRLHYLAKLLRGKVTLAQHRHLLVGSGWLATLLACLQFDLGDRDGAEASQAAAYTFAHEAEHEELLAWTYELLAWWALVDHRYDEVIEHARTGLAIAPHTSAGVQLAVQEAKGWSRLGDAKRADEALRTAGTVLSRLPRPEHPEHHFVFDASKLSFYAATCYTWLGDRQHARDQAEQEDAHPGRPFRDIMGQKQ